MELSGGRGEMRGKKYALLIWLGLSSGRQGCGGQLIHE